MRKINSISTLLLFVLLMTSCTQVSQTFKDTFKDKESEEQSDQTTSRSNAEPTGHEQDEVELTPEPEEIPEPTNFLSDSLALAKAQQQLMDLPAFQNKDLKFYSSIHFYADGRVNIQMQDPGKLENVDEYGYRDGSWGEPKPVRLSSQGDLNRSLSPLDEIRFSSVASIFDQIAVKSQDIEGADEVTHIYFVHSPVFKKKEWYASVSGTRESYSIRADIEGESVSFRRN